MVRQSSRGADATESGVKHAPAADAARDYFRHLEVAGADERIGDASITPLTDIARLLIDEGGHPALAEHAPKTSLGPLDFHQSREARVSESNLA
jgi:hypothetical protein